jgi:Fe-S oxidoreductase
MQFDPFIIPFNIGLFFIVIYAIVRSIIWFRGLSRPDKLRLQRGFFGKAFGQSFRDIFLESLLHRKIFQTNIRLGYMHMSLAFGWFLLILFGTIEADVFGEHHLNAPYKAIFFKYFNPEHGSSGIEKVYSFLMDLILAFILSGLFLAVVKRFSSEIVGMKRTTKLNKVDRIALVSLWLIFPSRLLAESLTSGVFGTGSFLTGSLGAWFATFLPVKQLAYPFWWLYSVSLGTFFVLLPLTRYMHIPTELFLIFMRNAGIRTGDRQGSYSEVQTYACSSCGICIDTCQLNFSAGITNIQSAYMLKGMRNNEDVTDIAHNCLMCGRCDQKCPVGIELSPIRMIARRGEKAVSEGSDILKKYFPEPLSIITNEPIQKPAFDWLPEIKTRQSDIIFFGGCMTHLTPAIKESMVKIMNASGLNWSFLDEAGGVCCGRPLMLSGRDKEARELINFNSQIIWKSGAHTLVTSCPICYKVFKESYYVDVEVLHHTQFIKKLIDDGSVKLNFLRRRVVYHTPCELGRGSGIYNEPKDVLRHISRLEKTRFEDEDSLCCGGSIGNLKISHKERHKIAYDTAAELTKGNPDLLVTSCPLCKKTLCAATTVKVADISELVSEALVDPVLMNKRVIKRDSVKVLANT